MRGARLVPVFGMDNFSRKQIAPFRLLSACGYGFDIFTNDQIGGSAENARRAGEGCRCFILERGALRRFRQLWGYLARERRRIAFAQIYPGGRYAFIYLFLCKIFGVRTLAVEWGTLVDWDVLPALTRFSMRVCYRFSDISWYREPYMRRMLERLGARDLVFIHNAAAAAPAVNNGYGKRYDFLWVNRLIRQRFSNWFVDILGEPAFRRTRNALLGLRDGVDEPSVREVQEYVKKHAPENLELHSYVPPDGFYADSRFFVLPASIVFCNNSLLEAMARGVVPVVSDTEGSRLIVDDGVDGFVAQNTPAGFRKAMERALALGQDEYEAMSRRAAAKVREKFSFEAWKRGMLDVFARLEKR